MRRKFYHLAVYRECTIIFAINLLNDQLVQNHVITDYFGNFEIAYIYNLYSRDIWLMVFNFDCSWLEAWVDEGRIYNLKRDLKLLILKPYNWL